MKSIAVALLLTGCTVNGPPVGPRQSGVVTVRQRAGNAAGELTAAFTVDTCKVQPIGTCTVVDCRAVAPSSVLTASAGTLSVAGTNAPLMLVPGNDGVYPAETLSGEVFRAGFSILVSALGSTVPAFSAEVKAPPALTVLAPVPGLLELNRAKDLQVAWATSIDAGVQLRLILDEGATLTCDWGGHDLQPTVPSLALEILGPGSGHWSVAATNAKVVTAATFVVTVSAVQDGQDSFSVSADGPLNIL